MLGSVRQVWLAGVRSGAFNIISSSHGSLLHAKAAHSIPCLRSSLSSLSSALENLNRSHFNTFRLQRRCWNVRAVQCFSTVPGPRRKRTAKQYPICSEDGCSTQAHYGWEGGRREFCGRHRKLDMVCVTNWLCRHPEKCRKREYFGFLRSHPSHCSAHKLEGMEDVKNKRCKEPGCNVRASFGLPGGRPTHCRKHKGASSVNVVSKVCEEPGCIIQPSYGDPENKVRRFCKTHKWEHMVSLTGKKAGKT